MKKMTPYFILAGLVVALASGCGSAPKEDASYQHGENYLPDGVYRDEAKFIDITVANGARADGTLRPVHFTGGDLNSLGKKKLDYMLAADTGSPTTLTVYIDLPKSNTSVQACHDSVTAYLKSQGVKPEQIALVDGPNTGYATPVAPSGKALDVFSSTDGTFVPMDSSTTK